MCPGTNPYKFFTAPVSTVAVCVFKIGKFTIASTWRMILLSRSFQGPSEPGKVTTPNSSIAETEAPALMAAKPIPVEKFPVNGYQKPFVLDSRGSVISDYSTADVMPDGWTPMGLQVCQMIHWDGTAKALVVATERERNGNVGIFDPIGGKFLLHLKNQMADRLYVADVSGDWREEFIILNGNELHVYHNSARNPNPNRRRFWIDAHYVRNKMTWNRSSN